MKQFVIGDKVKIPKTKSIGNVEYPCRIIKAAREAKQDHLFVVEVYSTHLSLSNSKISLNGNYFKIRS